MICSHWSEAVCSVVLVCVLLDPSSHPHAPPPHRAVRRSAGVVQYSRVQKKFQQEAARLHAHTHARGGWVGGCVCVVCVDGDASKRACARRRAAHMAMPDAPPVGSYSTHARWWWWWHLCLSCARFIPFDRCARCHPTTTQSRSQSQRRGSRGQACAAPRRADYYSSG